MNINLEALIDGISNSEAEKIGLEIATNFSLKRCIVHADRWQTESGDYTNKGIARRALRMILEGLENRS